MSEGTGESNVQPARSAQPAQRAQPAQPSQAAPPSQPAPPARPAHQLVFSDLTDYPVMAQALDNQWVPAGHGASRQSGDAVAGPSTETVAAASAELRRSLVNSGTLVVNRAYFLNNEALNANYRDSAEPSEREAFVRLLNDRALVPFLLTERDAAGEYTWGYDRSVHRAWGRLLADEADAAYVRFDWDDDANRERTDAVGNFFSRELSGLRRLRAPQLAKNLGIPVEQARAMREGILKDLYVWAGEQDVDRNIYRQDVYSQFLSRPGTEPYENLLREGEHIVPAKQLIDLLYNMGIPKASKLIALTPPDSPPRSTLEELRSEDRARDDDPEAIGLLLRDLFADSLHRAVDGPNSYGSLSLEDITKLRREEEWRGYVNALDAFVRGGFRDGRLPSAEEFSTATSDIARRHARMLRAARKVSRSQRGFQREIVAAVVLESAGISLQITGGGDVSVLEGSIGLATAAAGAMAIRLEFRERGAGGKGRRAGLSHSVTLPTLRLGNLKKDWATILRVYDGQVAETGATIRSRQADQQSPDA